MRVKQSWILTIWKVFRKRAKKEKGGHAIFVRQSWKSNHQSGHDLVLGARKYPSNAAVATVVPFHLALIQCWRRKSSLCSLVVRKPLNLAWLCRICVSLQQFCSLQFSLSLIQSVTIVYDAFIHWNRSEGGAKCGAILGSIIYSHCWRSKSTMMSTTTQIGKSILYLENFFLEFWVFSLDFTAVVPAIRCRLQQNRLANYALFAYSSRSHWQRQSMSAQNGSGGISHENSNAWRHWPIVSLTIRAWISKEKISKSELDTTFLIFPHFFLPLVGLPFCPPGRYCSTAAAEKSAENFKILYPVLTLRFFLLKFML